VNYYLTKKLNNCASIYIFSVIVTARKKIVFSVMDVTVLARPVLLSLGL